MNCCSDSPHECFCRVGCTCNCRGCRCEADDREAEWRWRQDYNDADRAYDLWAFAQDYGSAP